MLTLKEKMTFFLALARISYCTWSRLPCHSCKATYNTRCIMRQASHELRLGFVCLGLAKMLVYFEGYRIFAPLALPVPIARPFLLGTAIESGT
jgi:hypothetical protein